MRILCALALLRFLIVIIKKLYWFKIVKLYLYLFPVFTHFCTTEL